MKHIYILNLFLLAFQSLMAQNNEVKVNTHKVIDGIIFYAINDTDVRQEIALTILPKNLSGYHNPITKIGCGKRFYKNDQTFFLGKQKMVLQYQLHLCSKTY
ncbi:hypothetical protein [Allomuricauda sp. F6463D]|uniref:hypothetical protein n=1 Tax=Allomuricauda sp. F6463D TaxID=2926409 RepID=UPI001FF1F895|nr:hypothetical protein [Muricauda sp. F6463D]MCK0161312.1 hypothetical protein [Muricauda sp. F6463D]